MTGATKVFSPLAKDYARYRPGYPAEVLDELVRKCGLTRDWVVADIGSGTGNLARLFLEAGNEVIGVEPNREMREAGEQMLTNYPSFRSLDGAAECIPLDNQSADLITVGQALHWFDAALARSEFLRILKPDGWVAITWNDRPPYATDFTRAYSQFASHCAAVQPSPCNVPFPSAAEQFDRLFGDATLRSASFPHTQAFDLEGILGRARSSGFVPQPGAPNHAELSGLLSDLFAQCESSGVVEFHYVARLHFGQLGDR